MTTELVGIYTKKVEGDTSKQWTNSGFFVHRVRIERKIRFFARFGAQRVVDAQWAPVLRNPTSSVLGDQVVAERFDAAGGLHVGEAGVV